MTRIPFHTSHQAHEVARSINRRKKAVTCNAQARRIETQLRRTDREAFWLFSERQPAATV